MKVRKELRKLATVGLITASSFMPVNAQTDSLTNVDAVKAQSEMGQEIPKRKMALKVGTIILASCGLIYGITELAKVHYNIKTLRRWKRDPHSEATKSSGIIFNNETKKLEADNSTFLPF
ncbi:MAG: hypothetical protein FWE47_00240 [Oscillospiraceae bacterium]|nr:hypothetical protein [Oscillospiraceae bacterium]